MRYCSESFNLLALSTYPVLLCFLHCLLNPLVCFAVFLSSFCFIPLLLQISPLITENENMFGDPRLSPAMFLPKYLTGCISHSCIVGGNHSIDVQILMPQSNEWCKFPHIVDWKVHINFLRSILSLGWFSFLAFFRRTRKVIITRSLSLPMSAPEKLLVLHCKKSAEFTVE